jgi:hypothetical protein
LLRACPETPAALPPIDARMESVVARPKSTDPRNVSILVRFTADERAELGEAVEASRCRGLSDYLRRRSLGRRIVSRENANAIAELRRVGGLLKHAITTDATHAADFRVLLASVNSAIGKLAQVADE